MHSPIIKNSKIVVTHQAEIICKLISGLHWLSLRSESGRELTLYGLKRRDCLDVLDEVVLFLISVACSAGVLLVRANAKSSRSFVRPAIFDLQLEWTVGVGAGERRKDFILIFIPLPPPFFLFLTVDHPLGINLSSPQPPAAIKIKDGGHNIRYEIT